MSTIGAASATDEWIGRARRLGPSLRRRASRVERSVHRRLLHVGNRVTCPICGWHGVAFAASRSPRRMNRICPGCASSERDRALHLWLARNSTSSGSRLLEVAPIGLLDRVAARMRLRYASVDLFSPRAQVRGDLCVLPFRDGAFDLVVCFHVLEHVPDDVAAVAEIARVLEPGGSAILSVPWRPQAPTTDEDPDAGPEERLRRFGQIDHVRSYGRDVSDRFRAGGLEVEEVLWRDLFSPEEHRSAALDGDDDRFWVCTPAGAGTAVRASE